MNINFTQLSKGVVLCSKFDKKGLFKTLDQPLNTRYENYFLDK